MKLLHALHAQLKATDDVNARAKTSEDIAALADKIALKGLIVPLVVRSADRLDIVDGRRRWQAIGLLIKSKRWPVVSHLQFVIVSCRLRALTDAAEPPRALPQTLTHRRFLLPLAIWQCYSKFKSPPAAHWISGQGTAAIFDVFHYGPKWRNLAPSEPF